MSLQAMVWAIEVRVGDPILKTLLFALCHHANSQWKCWPSQELLAYETEVSKRTIQRKLEELQEKGLIRIERRRHSDGTQDNSMIILTGGQPVTLMPPVDKNEGTGGQKEGVPVDNTCPPVSKLTRELARELSREETESVANATVGGPEPKSDATVFYSAKPSWPHGYQDQFWSRYPNKKAKGAAIKSLEKIARGGKTDWDELMAGLERYIISEEVKRGFVKHPATWLNAQCWSDEAGPRPPRQKPLGFFEIAAGHGD